MKTFGVIMAGGGGTRFWPLSRHTRPKQLLNLTGRDTMIGETIARVSTVADPKDIYIVTNVDQVSGMQEAVGERIAPDHILTEPVARNTAACIGYAAETIVRKYGDGVMCIFPSDHYIRDEKAFTAVLQQAVQVAQQKNCLVTLGITPTFPSTGYGYIRMDSRDGAEPAHHVLEFKEKPDLATAGAYVASGEYAWNSGMFVWKASVILEHMKRLLPDVYRCVEEIGEALDTDHAQKTIETVYPAIPSISIDYGILEKSDDVMCISADMGWNDVGSWDNMEVLHPEDADGNVFVGDHEAVDTTNTVTYSGKRLIATVGVDNLIVVETEDAILVCAKDRAQDVKKVVEKLKEDGRTQYL